MYRARFREIRTGMAAIALVLVAALALAACGSSSSSATKTPTRPATSAALTTRTTTTASPTGSAGTPTSAAAAHTPTTTAGRTATTSAGATATKPPSGGTSASPTASQLALKVTETESKITPATMTARKGMITFEITNSGTAVHNLSVDINGATMNSPDVQPGKTQTWSVQINTAGSYQLYSSKPGDKSAGMVATLTVTS